VKVLIVDDHAVMRRGIRELLSEEFPHAEFAEAANGEEAVGMAEGKSFDLVVLDLSMPRRGGLDALKDLRVRSPKVRVLVLSYHTEEQYAIRALRAGAQGYLTKDSAPEELTRAARALVEGGKYISAAVAGRMAEDLDRSRDRPAHEALSDRELQVLALVASGKSVKDIAAQLSLSEKTVSTYRTRVLEKMHMQSNTELIRYALQSGLVD
jgi:DNA-binding NarL/FixJ family response regulator